MSSWRCFECEKQGIADSKEAASAAFHEHYLTHRGPA